MTQSSRWTIRLGVAALVCALPLGAMADSLTVSPTRLSVPAPGVQTTLTLKAKGRSTAILQMRVMRWNPRRSPEDLQATRDVVVSPPMAKLRPRQELTVRILRVSRRPVRGQECYRVLVDRLPGREQAGQAVKLRIRQSLPLCFTS